MKVLNESGSRPVWPKVFKCRNCGIEFAVESFGDMEKSLPTFMWLESPPAPPKCFQFFCPNECGAGYVSTCPISRQGFHTASFVMYGGVDLAYADFGDRRLVDVDATEGLSLEEALKLAPTPKPTKRSARAGKQYRFIQQVRRSRRREGDGDGTVSSS